MYYKEVIIDDIKAKFDKKDWEDLIRYCRANYINRNNITYSLLIEFATDWEIV